MTARERVIDTVLCRKVDRLPFTFYFGTWAETEERWHGEGLPQGKGYDYNVGFDCRFRFVPVNLGYFPRFEPVLLENRGATSIVRDEFGVTKEIRNEGSSIPRYIDFPVRDRADWEKLKSRLDPDSPGRFPADWKAIARSLNESGDVIQLGEYPYGLFGTLRDMMGVEELLVGFYTQPELIREIMDYLTDFWLEIYGKAVRDVRVDAIHMWEDMSGKTGSLISPQMIREFMAPNYKKIKRFADAHDIPIFSLDTDGDVSRIVPEFVDCGINLLFPFEVAAGCDVNEYRKKYPKLCLMGGIDKREIAKGKEGIDRELYRLRNMFRGTGYIPAPDHLLPPDIAYADFLYFMERLKEYIGIEK